jgi:hypothetical protein
MPDPAPLVRIVKSFSYRGATQEFSNSYHLLEEAPATHADWELLFDAVVDLEKHVYGSGVTIVLAQGKTSDDAVVAHQKVYTTAGTFSGFDAHGVPGDAAALLRFATNVRSVKGHPIYCFNYFHACACSGSNADNLNSDYKTALETYGTAWVTGIDAGDAGTFHRATPHGQSTVSRLVSPFVRHRDFPG